LRRILLLAGVTAAATALAIPFVGSDYLVGFFFNMFLFIAMACGWNLISGYAAYISFGQISFFGVGAYALAILVVRLQWPWPLALLAGMGIAVALSFPLGWVMLRLRGPYFSLGMLGLVEVFRMIASAWSGLTRGGEGIYLPPDAALRPLYYSAAALTVAGLAITWLVERSAFGLRLQAIREDELAAEAMGVGTTRVKLWAFGLASVFPSAAGGLYAWRLSYIDPSSAFPTPYEVTTILMTIFGGAGTVWGPLVGGVILTAVEEVLWAKFAELHLLLFGAMIILVLLFMPAGLIPLLRKLSLRYRVVQQGGDRKEAA